MPLIEIIIIINNNENMFTLVIKHIRNRIVADFTGSYDNCEPGLMETV